MLIKDSVYVYRLVGGERLTWHGRYHTHAEGEYELHFFLDGAGAFLANRARHSIETPRIFLTGPHEFHSILPEAVSRPLSYYAILFEAERDAEGAPLPEDARALALIERRRAEGLPSVAADQRDRFFFEELIRLSRGSDEAGRRAASYQLLSLIFRWFGEGECDSSARQGRSPHVGKALSLMAAAIRDKVGIEAFAMKLGISEEHFIRTFHAELGMSPFQYYTRLKVEGASGLLADTRMSVGAIAEHFGFENQFHFSRVFRKCTGLSPLAYRKVYSRSAAGVSSTSTSRTSGASEASGPTSAVSAPSESAR